MSLPSRQKVLGLYRTILRGGKKWDNPNAKSKKQVKEESDYIIAEAKELFRKNKQLSDETIIQEKVTRINTFKNFSHFSFQKIFEAESRIGLASHYKIPYPRLFNAPPKTYEDDLKSKRIKPAYMHSYDD